eukprot:jgi/Hompol1/3325/HPOL_006510-RA
MDIATNAIHRSAAVGSKHLPQRTESYPPLQATTQKLQQQSRPAFLFKEPAHLQLINSLAISKLSTPTLIAPIDAAIIDKSVPRGQRNVLGIYDVQREALVGFADVDFQGDKGQVCVSSNGTVLVTNAQRSGTMPLVWDGITGKLVGGLQGHRERVCCMAMAREPTSNGQVAVITGSWDWTAKIWLVGGEGTSTPSQTRSQSHSQSKYEGDQGARSFSALEIRSTVTLRGHVGSVLSVALTADGRTAATGGRDHVVRVWHVVSGECRRSLSAHAAWIYGVALSPGAGIVASVALDGALALWRDAGARLAHVIPVQSQSHPQSQPQSQSQSQLSLLLVQNHLLADKTGLSVSGSASGSASTSAPAATSTATSGTYGSSSFYEEDHQQLIHQYHQQQLREIGGFNDPISIQNILRHQQLPSASWVHCVALSHDGTIAATGSQSGAIHLWDTHRGIRLRTLLGHLSPVRSLVFSSTSLLLISASESDGSLRIWSVSTGACMLILSGCALGPDSIAMFDPK